MSSPGHYREVEKTMRRLCEAADVTVEQARNTGHKVYKLTAPSGEVGTISVSCSPTNRDLQLREVARDVRRVLRGWGL